MNTLSDGLLLLFSIAFVSTKEAELPLCPTNVQFFPQTLPMHCRMPSNGILPGMPQLSQEKSLPTAPPNLSPFYQSPPPDHQGNSVPFIVSQAMPGPMPFGGPGPMPMMPMSPPVPPHKLPVIVMPFYSPDPAFKNSPSYSKPKRKGIKKKRNTHRRPRYGSTLDTGTSVDTDSSSETSNDASTDREWWRKQITRNKNTRKFNRKYKSKKIKRNHNNKKEMLTPVLQYVTKDGYVIYEKEISKGEAQDWLDVKNDRDNNNNQEVDKQIDDLNLSEGRETKIEGVKPKVSGEEEKPKYIQKTLSKRKRARNSNPGIMKTP